ncbi:MAG: type VI secretion system tube protein Hcp, partial [Candidatus Thiodiazotropha sp. (ex Lucinoma kastoroae)]|nr:type VI secretion system tube protein Hcp [Candidatus Thiodiazotropha sp. (ex Lucinoma kastoroae)]
MAVDMFMKIEGVDGESTDDAHNKWIELLSFSHGVSQPVSG